MFKERTDFKKIKLNNIPWQKIDTKAYLAILILAGAPLKS